MTLKTLKSLGSLKSLGMLGGFKVFKDFKDFKDIRVFITIPMLQIMQFSAPLLYFGGLRRSRGELCRASVASRRAVADIDPDSVFRTIPIPWERDVFGIYLASGGYGGNCQTDSRTVAISCGDTLFLIVTGFVRLMGEWSNLAYRRFYATSADIENVCARSIYFLGL